MRTTTFTQEKAEFIAIMGSEGLDGKTAHLLLTQAQRLQEVRRLESYTGEG